MWQCQTSKRNQNSPEIIDKVHDTCANFKFLGVENFIKEAFNEKTAKFEIFIKLGGNGDIKNCDKSQKITPSPLKKL